jgi:hypothetical protein
LGTFSSFFDKICAFDRAFAFARAFAFDRAFDITIAPLLFINKTVQ